MPFKVVSLPLLRKVNLPPGSFHGPLQEAVRQNEQPVVGKEPQNPKVAPMGIYAHLIEPARPRKVFEIVRRRPPELLQNVQRPESLPIDLWRKGVEKIFHRARAGWKRIEDDFDALDRHPPPPFFPRRAGFAAAAARWACISASSAFMPFAVSTIFPPASAISSSIRFSRYR